MRFLGPCRWPNFGPFLDQKSDYRHFLAHNIKSSRFLQKINELFGGLKTTINLFLNSNFDSIGQICHFFGFFDQAVLAGFWTLRAYNFFKIGEIDFLRKLCLTEIVWTTTYQILKINKKYLFSPPLLETDAVGKRLYQFLWTKRYKLSAT